MIRDKRDFLLGAMAMLCAMLLLGNAPSEWGIWDDPDQAPWKRMVRLDGANSAMASGTWDLSGVTLHVASIVVDGTTTTKVLRFSPQLDAVEQSQIAIPANAGTAFTIQEATEISLGSIGDEGTFRTWQLSEIHSATDPLRYLAVAGVRSIRSVIR